MKLYEQYLLKELPERNTVEEVRKSNKYIYLYHGTRADDNILKKEGLRLKKSRKYGFDEEIKYGDYISFTSNKDYAFTFTNKGLFIRRTSVLICRLETKFLKFMYNNNEYDEYIYLKDINPKDIIFPKEEKYKKIENNETYLMR